MTKIKIIGAGPAGIFAAKSLSENPKYKIEIIDAGKNLEERICPVEKGKECLNCSPCNIHQGFGGAGTMSDGKLNFDAKIGNNLSEIISDEKNEILTKKVEDVFVEYGAKIIELDRDKISEIEKKALQNNVRFVASKNAHIGSEKLSEMMKKIRDDLTTSGVQLKFNKRVTNLKDLDADYVILALGRSGAEDIEKILKKNNIYYEYRPIDLGVRIEVPKQITDFITDFSRDMKFYIFTEKGQTIRTFCTCPGGYVDREKHNSFKLVNGHSYAEKNSSNTNFALLTQVKLTEPTSNTNQYSKRIAEIFYFLSGGSGIISQRLGDLKRGVRSKWYNQEKYFLNTTISNPVWGDIAMGMPSKHLENLIESVDKLNLVIPGISAEDTIWHAPEIKFHGLKIKTDGYLHAKDGIYVVGDGSGYTRGIVGAAVSGLLAAEGIKRGG